MEKELVLKVMKEAGKPIAAGEVAALSGLDRKVVDKVFAELKKEGGNRITGQVQMDSC